MFQFMTTRNVGNLDRVVRGLPALVTAWMWSQGSLTGMPFIVATVVSAAFLMTSILGSCSIYYMLGWSTCPVSGRPRS